MNHENGTKMVLTAVIEFILIICFQNKKAITDSQSNGYTNGRVIRFRANNHFP